MFASDSQNQSHPVPASRGFHLDPRETISLATISATTWLRLFPPSPTDITACGLGLGVDCGRAAGEGEPVCALVFERVCVCVHTPTALSLQVLMLYPCPSSLPVKAPDGLLADRSASRQSPSHPILNQASSSPGHLSSDESTLLSAETALSSAGPPLQPRFCPLSPFPASHARLVCLMVLLRYLVVHIHLLRVQFSGL